MLSSPHYLLGVATTLSVAGLVWTLVRAYECLREYSEGSGSLAAFWIYIIGVCVFAGLYISVIFAIIYIQAGSV